MMKVSLAEFLGGKEADDAYNKLCELTGMKWDVERTCHVVNKKSIDLEEYGSIVGCLTVCNLSCGHVTFCASWKPERPKHCSECGAKVTE